MKQERAGDGNRVPKRTLILALMLELRTPLTTGVARVIYGRQ
jgi:hypothetical protein